MKRNKCLICQSNKLLDIIDLGNQPYADTFVDIENSHKMLPVYRLSCDLCEECGQVQTKAITNPTERYNLFNYSYTSSNSSVAKKHWNEYSQDIIKKTHTTSNHRVCEIGSNDGYLLSLFKERKNDVLGIDASKHLVNIANVNQIRTIQSVFDFVSSQEILKSEGSFDLVIANNVFNHSNEPLSFANGVNNILCDGGYFIFEVPYWKNTVDSHKIDQIYHEHVSYFTARSAKTIMEETGFSIIDIRVVDYHGGSLRVYAKKTENMDAHCAELYRLMHKEKYLFDKKTYQDLNNVLQRKKISFLTDILKIKTDNNSVIAIGAAAKGNTFLNYMNLDSTIIDYVTDSSPHKQGKSTPLTNIKIMSDDILKEYEKVYAIILSWNLSDKIKEKLRSINKNIKFINFYEDYQ